MNDMRHLDNFFDKLMNSGYEILVKETINWPKDLTAQQRIQLLEAAITYFLQTESYEKCAVLKKQIDRVVEEYATPAKKQTRRSRKKKSEQTLTVNDEWD